MSRHADRAAGAGPVAGRPGRPGRDRRRPGRGGGVPGPVRTRTPHRSGIAIGAVALVRGTVISWRLDARRRPADSPGSPAACGSAAGSIRWPGSAPVAGTIITMAAWAGVAHSSGSVHQLREAGEEFRGIGEAAEEVRGEHGIECARPARKSMASPVSKETRSRTISCGTRAVQGAVRVPSSRRWKGSAPSVFKVFAASMKRWEKSMPVTDTAVAGELEAGAADGAADIEGAGIVGERGEVEAGVHAALGEVERIAHAAGLPLPGEDILRVAVMEEQILGEEAFGL